MNITSLGGHSGCKIELCEPDSGAAYVKKTSSSLEYNDRLKAQKEKQERFCLETIKTPKVLSDGFTDSGLYFFTMEYIHGITLSEYIKKIEVSKLGELARKIVRHMTCFDVNGMNNETIFFDKISELEKKVSSYNNETVNEGIALLKEHNWNTFSNSFCHGDLTLENIIIKNDEIYLIDFLDSFYDCWILDLGTLLQDVEVMWAYRQEEKLGINTLIRLIVFRDILIDEAKSIMGESYIEIYYALLLKLIRIYPYVKDEATYKFLNNKITRLLTFLGEYR